MSTDAVSAAVLQFATTYSYPEAEDVVTAELTPPTLTNILTSLRKQRDDLKQEIRLLSKTNGPNVEAWIDQAKKLQGDIQRSRDVARQIVEQHEQGEKLKADTVDASNKIGLLEREIVFEESLETTLRQVKDISSLLGTTQDEIIGNKLEAAYTSLESAKTALTKLGSLRESRCVLLLRERGKRLQTSLEEAVEQHWIAIVEAFPKQSRVTIDADETARHVSIQAVAHIAKSLGLLDRLVQKLCRDLERSILRPLFSKTGQQVTIDGPQLTVKSTAGVSTLPEKLAGLQKVLHFLNDHTEQVISAMLHERLLPKILAQVEEAWLEPAIPTDISEIKEFEASATNVSSFVDFIHTNGLGDAKPLQAWLDTLPKAWITKRRETLLSDARNVVFQRIHETKAVERIESQMVSKDDAVAAQMNGGDDDWDTAWDDNETEQTTDTVSTIAATTEEEDDGSAWDVDEPSEAQQEEQDGAEDAWGWGDDGNEPSAGSAAPAAGQPPSPKASRQTQREVTFRESYTVTAVPDEILTLIQNVISDAQRLATDEFADSLLAPAAAGLYSLPTLALAIYRATAPTAYAKLPTGNMLIYNDATRLSERLREWQASQPPASRLRLDNDAKALDLFAKRAYSAEMESQKTILRDILDGAQGFSNCTAPPFKQECEGAVEQAADRLSDVFKQWKDILGHNALLQSLGQLLSGVTGKMIADIEDLSDIGEEDSKQLKALCERLSAVKTIFAQQQADGDIRDMTFVYCPNWLKFQYLAEILESSLADIKFLWQEGELSLEFTSEEVVDLIKALFADSDHRRKLIGELRRQSRR